MMWWICSSDERREECIEIFYGKILGNCALQRLQRREDVQV
jgi:hypothetical protein